ncbi:type I DNA topoisomerase [Aphanizomenon flos-aquae NRERC-008]|jgi:DNA topoisomerase-1|uniref:DNA topoisomerase 1 n=3 Tax=Aphanizomenon flos-aquae TaxID=1176 RepID=A0A1B7X1B2_APHFL|nr:MULTISPECIES: type I DNA topoisomerase [Aphanizomenon]MBO1043545.1 type I DNA topoisomerase [Aphanizomenon flos-aquae UKL13-PB]MCE2905998.1 type I DNA topoisomerase [Anabaena sp. CoA2_C59]MDJ0506895.1 type I DNA topoisomerase [Nostocales cyanobacterium LE14-WE12]OBQ21880.1 MAG: DNA topoisomerase I [Anabaena sp. WA113]OBQ26756.1 MAG: DNA topoisomerase I [Aphanizomenon flos-aquae LD13]OBQ43165.1 MAG: DNA topoisomerase I [Aphanizomenon flos-aquae WA102]HCQ20954.1 type I DNA topoisomerase [An
MSTLVIVESPTKARTIRNYLPNDYRVEASMGHVRDLPQSASEIPAAVKGEKWAQLGVNVEADFEPIYVVPKDKKKIVTQLKEALKGVSELILATDEDREGESISWHLYQLLKPKVPTKRMVFHEITKEAIQKALKDCRNIDEQLVRAQETRRILDRLVGYTLSPLLWKKIAWGLSAGRVQSVAVRLLVTKERQRRAFHEGTYWDLKASLEHEKSPFSAVLVTLGGTKVATGSDFDPTTGRITAGRNVVLLNEEEAEALKARLEGKTWTVTDMEERPVIRKPAPPFTTSTLQQESNRKLRLSARDTMRVAQNLYEQGYITYMRTDSVHLSDQAISAARACVEQKYGKQYLSPQPRQYTTKSKGAQEAHEAIRPAGSSFRTPQETGLAGREFSVYDLIWKRTVASQMADSRQTQVTVQIQVEEAGFRSSGKRIDFPGYLRAYVEGSDDPDAALEDQEVILPNLKVGDHPQCNELEAVGHETQPPARYTEATLVKTLESEGIGRPSTYASIIGTIIDKDYAQLVNNALIPTFTAFAVTDLLEKHFPDIVDPSFTSKMEQTLDEISTGEAQWLPYLKKFYLGEQGLETLVREQETEIDATKARTVELENLDAKVRIGKYGPYIEVTNGEEVITASIPKNLTPADLNPKQVEILLKQKTVGPDQLGRHPETGEPIYIKLGTYGPYVQLGDKTEENPKPKQASLLKGVTPETLTLEMAVGLLSLPRALGTHPETGGKVQASLGRFGPYVVHDQGKEGKDYRSLKSTDDVLTISLNRALELLAEPKKGRTASKSKSKEALRELGLHPEDDSPINIYDGPYGPYIKHGKTNASIPEGETVENITLSTAIELLSAKISTKSPRKTTKSTTTRGKKKDP